MSQIFSRQSVNTCIVHGLTKLIMKMLKYKNKSRRGCLERDRKIHKPKMTNRRLLKGWVLTGGA